MSLVQNPFSRRGYLLSVSDIEVAATSNTLRLSAWGSHTKRALALVMAFAFVLFSVGSGFLIATSSAPKANADPFSDIFCQGLDKYNDVFSGDGNTYYGDASGAGNDNNYVQLLGDSLLTGRAAGDGTLPVMEPGKGAVGEKLQTAYEKYTPFLPEFDFWYGAYTASDAKANIHMLYNISKADSSDGKAHKITGSLSSISSDDDRQAAGESVGTSKLFFHDAGSCIGGKFGGSAAVLGVNTLFAVPQMLTFFSAEIYGWAYQNSAISDDNNALHSLLYGSTKDPNSGLDSLITGYKNHPGLKDVLYLPFLIPIIMLAALSLAWTGLVKRQSIAAAQAAIWMAAASIVGLLLLWHPTWVPGAADFVVSKVDDATMSALNSDNQTQAMCALDVKDSQKSDPSIIARELKCTMWYNTIYVPWVSGQFGVSAEPDKDSVLVQRAGMSENVLNASKITLGTKSIVNGDKYGKYVVNWATFQLENQSMADQYVDAATAQKGKERASMVAWSQLSGAGSAKINTTWGGDAIRQGNAAILAGFAALGSLLLVLTSAIMLIAYQISVIFLIVLSPFFFLLGAIPGFGRRIMIRWFELILATVVKRIVLTLLVAVFLRLYSMIMQLDINWWLQIVLITIIAVVALLQRGKIVSLFVDAIDFGGDKRIGDGTDGIKKFGGKLLGAAAGAAAGRIGARAGLGNKIAGAYANVGGDGDGGTGLTGTGDGRRSDAVAAAADARENEAIGEVEGNETRKRDAEDVPLTTREQLEARREALGNEPQLEDFDGDEIEQEAQYQAALADFKQRESEYNEEHGELTNVSKREQKRAKAARDEILRGEKKEARAQARALDPITEAQLKANKKAKREGMFTGMVRGWDSVDLDARGNLKLNHREFGRIYQGAKKDAKSTELNALLALDQAAERARGIDTHNLLTRQVELQERMLAGGGMPVMPTVRPITGGGDGDGPSAGPAWSNSIPPGSGPVGGFDANGNPTWRMVEPQPTMPTPPEPTAPYSAVDQNGATAGIAGVPAGVEEGAVMVERPQYAEPNPPVSGGSVSSGSGSAAVLDRPRSAQQPRQPQTPTRTASGSAKPVTPTAPAKPVQRVPAPQVTPARNITPPVAPPAPAAPQVTTQPSSGGASAAGISGFGAPVSQARIDQAFAAADAPKPAAPAIPPLDYSGPAATPNVLSVPEAAPQAFLPEAPQPQAYTTGSDPLNAGRTQSVGVDMPQPKPDASKMTAQEKADAVQNRVQEIQAEKQASAERKAERQVEQQNRAAQAEAQRQTAREEIARNQQATKNLTAAADKAQSISSGLRGNQTHEGKTSAQWAEEAKKRRQEANANEASNRADIKAFNDQHQGNDRIAQSKIPFSPFPGAGKVTSDGDRNEYAKTPVADKIQQGRQAVKGRVERVQDTGAAVKGAAGAAKDRVTGGVADRLKAPREAAKNAADDLKATRDEAKDKFGKRK